MSEPWRIPAEVDWQLRSAGATDDAVDQLDRWWERSRPCMDGQDLLVPADVLEVRFRSEPSA